ncbi:MAG: transglutaminase family protein, partial [Microbacteriaceae bacterium]|nr:transglutaminase family protein [Microbacteriaceae bacterium]
MTGFDLEAVRADHHSPRSYLVRHVTRYEYDAPRVAAYELGRLTPRPTPTQTVRSTATRLEPAPLVRTTHTDRYGNLVDYIEVREPYTVLELAKESIVDVHWPAPDLDALNARTLGETAAHLAAHGDPVEAVEFALPSPLVAVTDAVVEYATGVLHPGMPFGEALETLTHAIHRDFAYRSGVTGVRTTLDELLAGGAGVCQDFAQLAIGCLRWFGVPARYVSGYLETSPPPGRPKLQGSDASHAWLAAMAGDGSWVDLDPTNDHFADSRYVVTAWGRDFADVSPLRGIVTGQPTTSRLDVGVDVLLLDDADEVAVEVAPPPA